MQDTEKRSLAVLGSTGSVGTQALDVARASGMRVDMLSANANIRLLEKQIREFSPRYCAVGDPARAKELKIAVADTATEILSGAEGICYGVEHTDATTVVNAILGEAGLMPTLAVIRAKKRLALSNKESLVVAGDIVMREAREYGVELLPVDSEHCAIFQCLQAGRPREVDRILLTASGGPFFGKTAQELREVTLAQTLAHPTWQMGAKITVDSATLMNKGFEVIEAVHLFGVKPQQVEVVVHRESIIHSAVEYRDGAVIAQMSIPDMRMCVQYAVEYPARGMRIGKRLSLPEIGRLTFSAPDTETFPLLSLAFSAVEQGGALPAVVNAANEVAVAAFLSERISFCSVADTVIRTAQKLEDAKACLALEDILAADKAARAVAEELVNNR